MKSATKMEMMYGGSNLVIRFKRNFGKEAIEYPAWLREYGTTNPEITKNTSTPR
jgi:hypothetical protein